ncbi:MAG: hypothetical protein LBB22_05010 [Treponema sp.]|nr:hypothetical protein [Treponema sp.]
MGGRELISTDYADYTDYVVWGQATECSCGSCGSWFDTAKKGVHRLHGLCDMGTGNKMFGWFVIYHRNNTG